MALSFATGLMGGAGGVGMGALGFAGYAQTFYYSGSLPLSNMPEVGGRGRPGRQRASAPWGRQAVQAGRVRCTAR